MTEPGFRSHFWCYPCDHDWTVEQFERHDAACPRCSRNRSPMYSDDLNEGPGTADAHSLFLNYYHCDRCRHEWTDEWSATCDDECPECGLGGCSPFYSEDLTEGGARVRAKHS